MIPKALITHGGAPATALLAFTMVGCSSVRPPSVQVARVELAEETSEAYVLAFHLDLDNPNRDPLELHEFEYRLEIDGRPVYEGRRSAEATLSANGGKQMVIPAVVRFENAGGSGVPGNADYALSGTLWYLTPGALTEMLFDTGMRRPSVSFSNTGELTLSPGHD